MEIVNTPLQQVIKFLPFIIPLVLLQLILMVVALLDLSKRERVRWLPKWLWAVIIIIGELIGPIVYLVVGRED
ncbi:MAG TPA: PLDc N-terminal domain-containing protein [Anaerolineales bacterium]|nr:PLDc N-terminal domain-containing protein [Anaerolineales bacterium]